MAGVELLKHHQPLYEGVEIGTGVEDNQSDGGGGAAGASRSLYERSGTGTGIEDNKSNRGGEAQEDYRSYFFVPFFF